MSVEQQQVLVLALFLSVCSYGLVFSRSRYFGYAEYLYVMSIAAILVLVSKTVIGIDSVSTAVLLVAFTALLGMYRTLAELLTDYLPADYTRYVFLSHVGIWSFMTTWIICW